MFAGTAAAVSVIGRVLRFPSYLGLTMIEPVSASHGNLLRRKKNSLGKL